MPRNWTEEEVQAIVEDYFDMFLAEIRGESYDKTAHRRALARRLNDRSEGSIEFKHQNLSAVLLEKGLPYISGYKPRRNYQGLLRDVTELYLTDHSEVDKLVRRDVDAAAEQVVVENILDRMEKAPMPSQRRVTSRQARTLQRAVDYLARESRNRSLGLAGEEFVVDFEKARLEHAGKAGLADRIEHVARIQGDGAGFDVLSFETNGTDRYIEVKTTRYGNQTPFYVTRNEVRFSNEKDRRFFLYRVFEYRNDPRMFSVRGALRKAFELSATQYRAALRAREASR